jgi:phage gp29-like protein
MKILEKIKRMVGGTATMRSVVVPQARDRWSGHLASTYTPDQLKTLLAGAGSGNLVYQWQLFDLMEDTWPRLTKNLNELKNAVVSLDWCVQAWAEQNAKPDETASQVARSLERAIWNMTPDPCGDDVGFTGIIRELLDGWAKGIAVVELDWEMRNGPDGQHVAPKCGRWVHPRYYGYSNQGTRLQLNAREVGGEYGRGLSDYIDFPEHKFLVAIHKARSGHVTSTALLRPLAWWWLAANFSGKWLLEFAEVFGQPMRWATYDPSQEGVAELVSAMLDQMGSRAWAALPEGTKLEFKEASKSGSDNPQSHLLDRADTICDIMILGQTLTTDAGDRGTQALGTVHQSVRADYISAAAEWVSEVLGQMVRSFCALNYGDVSRCPWMMPASQEHRDEVAMAQRDQILAQMGMRLPDAWLYERHDVPLLDGEAEMFSPTKGTKTHENIAEDGEKEPRMDTDGHGSGADELITARAPLDPPAGVDLARVMNEDFAGVLARVEGLGGIENPEELRRAVDGMVAGLPAMRRQVLEGRALRDALWVGMAEAAADGAVAGIRRKRTANGR